MFRNLSFRVKLAFVVLPALLIVAVLATAIVQPRLTEASDASDNLEQARIATANMQYRDEVQIERDLTMQFLSGTLSEEDLQAHRSATEVTRSEFLDLASGRVDDPAVARTVDITNALDEVRARVDDGSVTVDEAFGEYTTLIDGHAELSLVLSRGATDAELVRQADVIYNFHLGKDQFAEVSSYVGMRLEQGTFTPGDLALTASLADGANAFLGNFATTASPELAGLWGQTTQEPEFATPFGYLQAIIGAAMAGEAPDVTAEEWWASTSGGLEAVDVVEDVVFDEFVAEAENIRSDARSTALQVGLLALLGFVLAAGAAFLLGRSISRRLATISSEAHTIANDRLPEVLMAMRNPTAEALAGAMPEVSSDASDEIGDMATSFNTVLRTSVETSIAHAQRRAETMTNILVSLGRRNQTLIDRQLGIVDRLESTQQDADVLAGLFEVDHMLTRMRRNAENLLVLASSRPARQWSQPVPLLDVVRGAVSEVQDMQRVSVDLGHGGDLQVSGPHTVDLSHLFAELIDNAVSYSPPGSQVAVKSEPHATQVRVWIVDGGVGMPDDLLAEANQRVNDPLDIEDVSTDQVGFQVIGRLAQRLGVSVRLQANPGGGIAACVTAPITLFESEAGTSATPTRRSDAVAAAGSAGPSPFELNTDRRRVDVDDAPVDLDFSVADLEAPAAPVTPPAAPAPVAAADPAPAVAPAAPEFPEVTAPAPAAASGPRKRVPGQTFNQQSSAVAAFESGSLRRLPTPDAPAAAAGEDEAVARLEAMRNLQRSVDRGRQDEESSLVATNEANGENP